MAEENRWRDDNRRDEWRGRYGEYRWQGRDNPHGNSPWGRGTYAEGRNENYGPGQNYAHDRDYDRFGTRGAGQNWNAGPEDEHYYRSGGQDMNRGRDWRTGYSSRGQSDWRDRQSSNWSGSNADQERGWWDRTTDEVSSWFGDEDAERRRRMDEQRDNQGQYQNQGRSQGQWRGMGPKGYTRSDDRIREDMCERLTNDSMVNASEIDVRVASGEVTLDGTVTSRDQRRRAEECVENITGVSHVQNNIRIRQDSMTGSSTGLTGGASTGSTGSLSGGLSSLGTSPATNTTSSAGQSGATTSKGKI